MRLTVIARCALLVTACVAGGCGHTPGGKATTWVLRDGTVVRFFKPSGPVAHPQESVKVLEVTPPGGPAREYTFGTNHGGYSWVELRVNPDESVVWLVDTDARYMKSGRRVGCVLTLATGEFLDQPRVLPAGVGEDTGAVVEP